MPTVRDEVTVSDGENEVTGTVDIDFEIWCAECGNGICGNTRWDRKRTNHFTTYCEKCLKASEKKDAKIRNLENRIAELESEVKDLEAVVEAREQELASIE